MVPPDTRPTGVHQDRFVKITVDSVQTRPVITTVYSGRATHGDLCEGVTEVWKVVQVDTKSCRSPLVFTYRSHIRKSSRQYIQCHTSKLHVLSRVVVFSCGEFTILSVSCRHLMEPPVPPKKQVFLVTVVWPFRLSKKKLLKNNHHFSPGQVKWYLRRSGLGT
jgi:hypothetical protein